MKILNLILLMAFVNGLVALDSLQHRIYLLPGQGSDKRIFNKLNFEGFDTVNLVYLIPEKNETMEQYAGRMLGQVDTTGLFSFVGVSLGGMISVEMAKKCHPEHVIIISSAQTMYELPQKYRIMKKVPFNRLFNGRGIKILGLVVQPIIEPDSWRERATFKSMMKGKDPLLLERGVNMIIHWGNTTADPHIVHIHGTRDHTIPIRWVDNPVVVKKGSHMMALTRSEAINKILGNVLGK
jgi:hypothetical protein